MIATELYGHITQRILEDTNSKDGELYISKAYFYNADDDEAVTDDINDLDEDKTTIFEDEVSSNVESNVSISVVVRSSLDDNITYNRIYYTNSDDKILFVVDINEVTASEIDEEILIQLDDVETIIN